MTIGKCFLLETKRYVKSLPHIVINAIALLFLCGAIAFCAIRYFGDSTTPVQASIGLYSEDSGDSSYAMRIAENYRATDTYFQFSVYESCSGMLEDLEAGVIMAGMYFPSGSVESILNGENYHVSIYMGNQTGLSALLLQELSAAGASILSSAQASTYTLTDLYLSHNFMDPLESAYARLDAINLRYALSSDQLFCTNRLSVSGSVSVPMFYITAAWILYLGLSGLCFSTYLDPYPDSFIRSQRAATMRRLHFCRFLHVLLTYILLNIPAFAVTALFLPGFSVTQSFPGDLIWFTLIAAGFFSLFVFLLYGLFRGNSYAPVLYFFLILLFAILAGFIIPAVFLGQSFRQIMGINPFHILQNTLIQILHKGGAV